MPKRIFALVIFFASLLLMALLALFGPQEKSLGSNVHIVYVYGAWVITAEIALLAAGITGLVALMSRRESRHRLSAALGGKGDR